MNIQFRAINTLLSVAVVVESVVVVVRTRFGTP